MEHYSSAIYEIIGFILALPLSYAMAKLAKIYSNPTYKDELNNLFMAYWNGEEEDELYAWLKVRQTVNPKQSSRKDKYIQRKIRDLNKKGLYSQVSIRKDGEITGLEKELKNENEA